MTIFDYVLLAGFVAASIYVVCRLFVGWRNSVSRHISTDTSEDGKAAADATDAFRHDRQLTAQHQLSK